MQNNKTFELRVRLNYGNTISLNVPLALHNEFERGISGTDNKAMETIVEFFGEYAEMGEIEQMTFRAMLEERANQIGSFNDLIVLLKTIQLCKAFDKWSNSGGI